MRPLDATQRFVDSIAVTKVHSEIDVAAELGHEISRPWRLRREGTAPSALARPFSPR